MLGAYLPALLSLSSVPSMVYLLASKWLVVDSPYTLVREGNRDAAVVALKRLRVNANLVSTMHKTVVMSMKYVGYPV